MTGNYIDISTYCIVVTLVSIETLVEISKAIGQSWVQNNFPANSLQHLPQVYKAPEKQAEKTDPWPVEISLYFEVKCINLVTA